MSAHGKPKAAKADEDAAAQAQKQKADEASATLSEQARAAELREAPGPERFATMHQNPAAVHQKTVRAKLAPNLARASLAMRLTASGAGATEAGAAIAAPP